MKITVFKGSLEERLRAAQSKINSFLSAESGAWSAHSHLIRQAEHIDHLLSMLIEDTIMCSYKECEICEKLITIHEDFIERNHDNLCINCVRHNKNKHMATEKGAYLVKAKGGDNENN